MRRGGGGLGPRDREILERGFFKKRRRFLIRRLTGETVRVHWYVGCLGRQSQKGRKFRWKPVPDSKVTRNKERGIGCLESSCVFFARLHVGTETEIIRNGSRGWTHGQTFKSLNVELDAGPVRNNSRG